MALLGTRPVDLHRSPHRALDDAVAAFGWPADLSDNDILARLLALNLERAAAQQGKAGA